MRFLTNVTIGAMIISSSIVCAQQKGDKMKVDKDMVLIPAGEFMMGGDTEDDHMPTHKVYVDSFYMDKNEVTNAQFQKYCEETDAEYPEYWGMEKFHCGPDFPNHPVVGVSWREASDYAEWAGKRLPTEAEWEYAARGGMTDYIYSYGIEPDTAKANYNVKGIKRKGSMPVGSYPPNGFGLHDMTGNVVEWVADYYDKDYYKDSPEKNPAGPEDGKFMVIRGGGWHSGAYCTRVYFRNALRSGWRDIAVGFRCVRDIE